MKALVFHGDHDLRYEEVPNPQISEHEALVKVKAVGICGSDIHGYEGKTGRRTPPMIMGHEFSGVVEKTGKAVTNVKAGDGLLSFHTRPAESVRTARKKQSISALTRNFSVSLQRTAPWPNRSAPGVTCCFRCPIGTEYVHGALVEPLSVAARGCGQGRHRS